MREIRGRVRLVIGLSLFKGGIIMENKIRKIYNHIFQIDFLIKYGYYDVSIKKKIV